MAEHRINERPPADSEQWNLRALREPTLLLTATYLATSAIGLWASYCFYKPFGIAVLDYMQPADFLVAALHDPMYFLVVLAGAFLSWIGSRIDAYRERRPHRVEAIREKRWWGPIVFPRWRDKLSDKGFTAEYVFAAMLLGIAAWLISDYTAVQSQRVLQGQGTRIAITYNNHDKPEAKQPILLGTNTAWVFLYWPEDGTSEAVPQGQVARIDYRLPGHGAKAAGK
ncbi:MAG TPA: hypothetical protein VK753_11795 [Xanthomonadaceae bacterium]|nr:hypothetical protein [Xanthomonadaceae bacterium]